MSTRPRASVVIPTFNRQDDLRLTLHSLEQQDTDAPFEVVVADDGSTDDTAAVVRELEGRLDLTYARQPDRGFRAGAARNLGARVASGEVLVFLDCGTLAGPALVRSHLDHVVSGTQATVGPTFGWDFTGADAQAFRDLTQNGAWQSAHTQMADLPGYADYRSSKWMDVRERRVPMALPWRFFWSRNIAVSRDDFMTCHGFDEGISGYGVEDIELGYRLTKQGISLAWSEDAWAVERPSVVEDTGQQAAQNRRNLQAWADRVIDKEVEFYVCNRPLPQLEQPEWERIESWAAGTTNSRDDLRTLMELSAGTRRVLFVGLMSPVPHSRGVVALGPSFPRLDAGWQEVGASPRRPLDLSAIGIRTGFSPASFDVVHLSDALAPLAQTWGAALLSTAGELGREVQVGPRLATALAASPELAAHLAARGT